VAARVLGVGAEGFLGVRVASQRWRQGAGGLAAHVLAARGGGPEDEADGGTELEAPGDLLAPVVVPHPRIGERALADGGAERKRLGADADLGACVPAVARDHRQPAVPGA